MNHHANYDQRELDKFAEMAPRWWDPQGECRPLHEINPLRLRFIDTHAGLKGKNVLDVGCGGGILSEGMAAAGAQVTAIDAGAATIAVAKLHLLESGLSVDYRCMTVERLAQEQPGQFDIVTCMEMLEHVPDPLSVITACAQLLKPNGHLFLSTLNRNPKAFGLAILGAEYLLGMLPRGTHDYAHFIKPSELESWVRATGLSFRAMQGITYNPLFKRYRLSDDISVNYLVHAC
ncbi:MAG: 2-polyprenyl-6-hydroxyphenyl methylase / 3-demethylubiquinone-9 3-methyltransferase [Halothiobacillaceae bacterium]|nr:MAG: 2-polyprenyl-6-hydroxyphenyl methylase / 3-demethylubiquinone-9 3-methyltransferase [Halothiobacillaceae bacterium]